MKFTNRTAVFLLISVVLLFGFVFAVTFTGDSVNAVKGAQQVVYPVYLNNSEAVAGFQAAVNYSTNYLTLTGVQTTSRTSGATVVYNDNSPVVKIAMLANNSSGEIAPGNGTVLNLIFNVDSDAVPGNYAFVLSDLVAVNISAVSLNVSSAGGNFEISNPYNVTFLPPISNFENFTLEDGSTLPFKFNVTNSSGFVHDGSVRVRIYNQSLGVDYVYNSSDITIQDGDQYLVDIHTGTNGLNLSEGFYDIDVSFGNYQTEGIGFELVDKANGIARGKNK